MAGDHQVAVGLRPRDAATEGLVLLLVDDRIVGGRRAQAVAEDPIGPERIRVLLSVEEGPAVVGPDHVRGDVPDRVVEDPARRQVLDADRVEAAAARIDPVGDQAIVRADLDAGHREIAVPIGQGVLVDQDFLTRLHRALLAHQDRVLLSGLEPGVVKVAVIEDRGRRIRLLDPADDLVVERLLERPGGGHERVGVGVLGVEIGDDLGIGPVLEPVVVVNADPPEPVEPRRDHLGLRGDERAGSALGPAGGRCEQRDGQDRRTETIAASHRFCLLMPA